MDENRQGDTQAYTPAENTNIPRRAPESGSELWREPVYTRPVATDSAYSPTRHGLGYGAAYARQQAQQARQTGAVQRLNFGRGIFMALLCILLGIAAGGTAAWRVTTRMLEEADTSAQVVLGAEETAATVSAEKGDAQTLYERACGQVVGIRTNVTTNVFGQTSSTAVTGSGCVISSDGYILTNYHVVEYSVLGSFPISVMFSDGTSLAGTVVGYENEDDIAVIKVEAAELEPVSFCTEMTVGETVYTVGNPLGELTCTMTEGIVSALDREVTGTDGTPINVFQIDAAVNAGNSGGPVYNAAGQVIGIVTAKYASTGVEGLGFAIPIGDAVNVATQLIENGYVSGKARLGVNVEDVSQSVAAYFNMPQGAYVYSVTQSSAAEAAGIRTGDIITAIDSAQITGSSELKSVLRQHSVGDEVTVTVFRAGEYVEKTAVLDEDMP